MIGGHGFCDTENTAVLFRVLPPQSEATGGRAACATYADAAETYFFGLMSTPLSGSSPIERIDASNRGCICASSSPSSRV